MPPTTKTTQPRQPARPADEPQRDERPPSTPRQGAHVRYELDGVTGHGLVVDRVNGDSDREEAVTVVPLPDAITVPVSALVKD